MTSIVILTFNGVHNTTVPCLDSIFRNTQTEDYEIIVVDNCSTDGTQSFLSSLAVKEPRLRLILNSTNRGYAGGNNDGIRAAKGDLLVLLNNDTQVGEDWLRKLREPLMKDSSMGLVGPVTNGVGNEQKIHISAKNPDDVIAEGACWTRLCENDEFDTRRLAFFCVALRRDVIERIGLLDEDFGVGFYEDDDYCIRVTKAGYRIVCREDAFVYHRGSASFEANPDLTRKLLKKNRLLLESKHRISWRPRHQRDRILDLIEKYLDRANDGNCVDRMCQKISNRLRLLRDIEPHGVIKLIKYRVRLWKVLNRIREMGIRDTIKV